MSGVVARSAISLTDIQIPVGSKGQMAGVVIGKRMRDELLASGTAPAQIESRAWLRNDWIGRSSETGDDNVALRIGEVDEEASAGRVIERKGKSEETLFAARTHGGDEIEEVGAEHRPVANHANTSGLLDDKLRVAIGWILNECDRLREARGMQSRSQLCLDVS